MTKKQIINEEKQQDNLPESYITDMKFNSGTIVGKRLLFEIGHDKDTGDMYVVYQ